MVYEAEMYCSAQDNPSYPAGPNPTHLNPPPPLQGASRFQIIAPPLPPFALELYIHGTKCALQMGIAVPAYSQYVVSGKRKRSWSWSWRQHVTWLKNCYATRYLPWCPMQTTVHVVSYQPNSIQPPPPPPSRYEPVWGRPLLVTGNKRAHVSKPAPSHAGALKIQPLLRITLSASESATLESRFLTAES